MTHDPIRITVAGAAGRMGRALIAAVADDRDCILHAALERPGHAALGHAAAPGVAVSDDALMALKDADAVLDFTAPAPSVALAGLAAQARIVHVIGTTGFAPDHDRAIAAAARHAVIVRAGNMSLGVTLLAALVRRAAAALGPDWDVEILEMHHRAKVDAPSGTALLLGRAAAEGRGLALDGVMEAGRAGETGARAEGRIGFASLRGGTVVGEHRVILAGPHERVELGHIAEDRGIFARGAVAAAKWGQGRKPGLYGMDAVLGLA